MYVLGCRHMKVGLLRKGLVVYSGRQMSALEIRRKRYEFRIQSLGGQKKSSSTPQIQGELLVYGCMP